MDLKDEVEKLLAEGVPFDQWKSNQLRYHAYVNQAGGCASCHAARPKALTADEVADTILRKTPKNVVISEEGVRTD